MLQDWKHVAAYVTQKDLNNTPCLQIHHLWDEGKEMGGRLLLLPPNQFRVSNQLTFFYTTEKERERGEEGERHYEPEVLRLNN